MRRDEDSLMNPPLEDLLKQIPQKYELVLTAVKLAKQIIRQQRINPMGVEEADKNRKPLSIALVDILTGQVDAEALKVPDTFFEEDILEDLSMFDNAESFGAPEAQTREVDEPRVIEIPVAVDDTKLPEEAELATESGLDVVESD